jgi:tetratricopeptide (TPR) repeat protein
MFSLRPILWTGLAVVPAFGQPGIAGSGIDDSRSLLWKTESGLRPADRFPRVDGEAAWWSDSLAPQATHPLRTATGKISAQVLQRPPSKKESKILSQAQALSEAGDRAKAIEILRAALPGASPYIHSRLGTEYLKSARPDLAIPELEAAVHLMPGESAHHANLAYAYRLTGRLDEGEREARAALELDHSSAPAHFMLGAILIARRAPLGDAIDHLKRARNQVRSAHLALAQVYASIGLPEASRKELEGYLAVAPQAEGAIAQKWFANRGFGEPAAAKE